MNVREIKFDAIYMPTGEHFNPISINFNDNTVVGNFDGQQGDWCHFSMDGKYGDVILRQCTGLKDSTRWESLSEKEREDWVLKGNMPSGWTGREIYEGDILKITCNFELRKSVEIDKVVWWEEGAYCCSDWTLFELNRNSKKGEQEFEVIGNIYENPELINS